MFQIVDKQSGSTVAICAFSTHAKILVRGLNEVVNWIRYEIRDVNPDRIQIAEVVLKPEKTEPEKSKRSRSKKAEPSETADVS